MLQDALLAINKFCYETLNFNLVLYEWKNRPLRNEYVPELIALADWNCEKDHIVEKWVFYRDSSLSAEEAFIRFYANLDLKNQDIMAEWIFNNGATGSGR